jgi:CDGSH-type Zn-finger protein
LNSDKLCMMMAREWQGGGASSGGSLNGGHLCVDHHDVVPDVGTTVVRGLVPAPATHRIASGLSDAKCAARCAHITLTLCMHAQHKSSCDGSHSLAHQDGSHAGRQPPRPLALCVDPIPQPPVCQHSTRRFLHLVAALGSNSSALVPTEAIGVRACDVRMCVRARARC